ncbi:MAG: carboxypeptidase regulatory-like domain-containing protein [Clostridia bacterium]|nr:carboxypeptidase regulatory-like domain-containing protein [Clostridia bacterium]
MTMLCKKLLSGLLALIMLLTLAPCAAAEEETRLKVTLGGLYATKDGSFQKVDASCVFEVYLDDVYVGALSVTPGGDESIVLPGGGAVSVIPVPGTYPAELPLSVFGYGVNVQAGRMNIAPVNVYANAGLFRVVGDYQADYALLNDRGDVVMTFRSDIEGGYRLERAIPVGAYTLRMTSAPGPLWEDQQFEIVTYTDKSSIVKLTRPAAKATAAPAEEATAQPTADPTVEPTPVPTEEPATPAPTPTATPAPVNGALTIIACGEEVAADYTVSSGTDIVAQGVISAEAPVSLEELPQGEYLITLNLADDVVLTGLNGTPLVQRGTAQWMADVAPATDNAYEIELTGTGDLVVPFENVTDAVITVEGERESFEVSASSEGTYEKRYLLPDVYEITVQLPAGCYEYEDYHQNWQLTENADGTCTLTMSFGVNQDCVTELPIIRRITIGDVAGKVVDIDGDALKGVQITLYAEDGQAPATAETDKNGEWAVTGLAYGAYTAQYTDDTRAIPATSFILDREAVTLFAQAAHPSRISVRVFEDANNNGSQGKNEGGLKNAQVSLLDKEGVTVAAGVTAKDGRVTLSAPAGEYTVKVVLPEDYGFGKAGNGKKDQTQSFMAESADRTQISRSVTLATDDTVEIGVGAMPMAVVTGTVWNDLNADGIWQKDEPGIPGIRLTLTGGKDKISYETYTDENGFYDFHQIKKGTYKVTCHVPDEYVFTVKAKGQLEEISRMTTEKDRAGEDQLKLEIGETYENHNIGLMEGAIIEGVCFLDANYNGVYDEGEHPLPGVEMRLARQSNNVMLQVVDSAEDGSYHFVGQRGSTFTIRATLPKGYVFTMVGEGENANLFAPNGEKNERRLSDVTLENGEYRRIMLGAVSFGSISGRVYYDDNFTSQWEKGERLGVEIFVTLYHMNGERAGRVRTNKNGLFTFENLIPGEYYMTMTPAKGYGFTALGAGNVMQTLPDGTGKSRVITVGMGEDVTDAGAGMIVPAVINGVFYADENDNGLREAGENGLVGATVRLMNEKGEAASVVIDATGEYRFATIPGTYYLQFELPGKGVFPYVVKGGNAIAGENGVGRSESFTVDMGDTFSAPLCGGVLLSDISGFSFTDSNGNAVMDADESLFTGLSITLTPSRSDLATITVATGADGRFSLTDLRPDVYTLTVSCPNNCVLSRLKDVELPLQNGLMSQSVTLDLRMGTQWHDQMLGCVLPSEWAGTAYLDENYNGVQDAGEAPAVGETLVLRDADTGEAVITVKTDENGSFLVEGIAPGEYELVYPMDEGNLVPRDVNIDFRLEGDVMTTGRVRINENQDQAGTRLSIVRTTEIGGLVWLEQHSGVTPVKGATVHLLDAQGKVIAEFVTGDDGVYVFKGLMPGWYAIDVTIPAGYVLVDTRDDAMAEKGLISVVEEVDGLYGKSAAIELRMARHRNDMDVGIVLPGRLGDKAWLDLNGNGLQDGEEGGIPGVTVTLLRDGAVIATTVTDQYGYYVFEGLYPTEYTLQVNWPAEVKPTILREEIKQISSVLKEDGTSVPVTVESNKANYAADLGFVLVDEGKFPAGYGEGETQKWKKK